MRKTVSIVFALMMGVTAFAQEYDAEFPQEGDVEFGQNLEYDNTVIYRSADNKFSFDIFGHIGIGFPIVTSNDFKPGGSSEGFINAVDFSYRFTDKFSVNVGIDYMWQEIRSLENIFLLDDTKHIRVDQGTAYLLDNYDYLTSSISTMGFSAPILLKGYFGKVVVGLGACLQTNLWGSTSYETEVRHDNKDAYKRAIVYVREKHAEVTPFTCSLMATLSYRETFGLYLRYYPSKYAIVPQHAGSPRFGMMTLGLSLGF